MAEAGLLVRQDAELRENLDALVGAALAAIEKGHRLGGLSIEGRQGWSNLLKSLPPYPHPQSKHRQAGVQICPR